MFRRTLFPFGWSLPAKLALILFLSALYVYLPVFTLYLQANGLSLLQVNSLWGILVASLFLAEVPTGMLADSSPPRLRLTRNDLHLVCYEYIEA